MLAVERALRAKAVASAGPGPAALEAQRGAAGVERQTGGGVQQPVAQRFGSAGGQVAVEREVLRPGDDVLGDQRDLQPHLVVGEVSEREAVQAGRLGGADALLGAGARSVQALEFDRIAVEVGQGDQEAVAIVVGETRCAPGCGRSRRTITWQPRASRRGPGGR